MKAEDRDALLNVVLAPLGLIALICMFLQYANWLFVIILGAFVAQTSLIKRHALIFDIFWFVCLFLVLVDSALALRIAFEELVFEHSISKAIYAISKSYHAKIIPFGWLPKILAYVFMFIMGILALINRFFPLKESDDPISFSSWYRNYLMIAEIVVAIVIAILAPTYY